jgi:competence protein ComEC
VVVISAGAGNRFGFPHAEVTDRYRAAGSRILSTSIHGAISMRSDGKTVHVHPEIESCGPSPHSPIF